MTQQVWLKLSHILAAFCASALSDVETPFWRQRPEGGGETVARGLAVSGCGYVCARHLNEGSNVCSLWGESSSLRTA